MISLKAPGRQQELKGIEGQMEKFVILKAVRSHITGVLISPLPDQEGNKVQRQQILMVI